MKATLIDATASEGVLHFRWIPPLSSYRWKVIIKLTQTGEESTQPERELTGMHFSLYVFYANDSLAIYNAKHITVIVWKRNPIYKLQIMY